MSHVIHMHACMLYLYHSVQLLLVPIIIINFCSKLRKKDNTKFRVQLCVALILMLVFFGIGIYQMATFQICILGSALLHYFTLVSAMWMASDALLMLLKLTKSFTHPPTCYIMIISLLCWCKLKHIIHAVYTAVLQPFVLLFSI